MPARRAMRSTLDREHCQRSASSPGVMQGDSLGTRGPTPASRGLCGWRSGKGQRMRWPMEGEATAITDRGFPWRTAGRVMRRLGLPHAGKTRARSIPGVCISSTGAR